MVASQPVTTLRNLDVSSQRIIYIVNSHIASLSISFFEPFRQTPNYGPTQDVITESEIRDTFGDQATEQASASWVLGRVRAFGPTLIVFCRYSGPQARTIVEFARANSVPTIFHIDDDLLNIPAELGAAKVALHSHPDRLATIRYLLAETTLVYCSTQALRDRFFGEAASERVFAGSIYCAHRVLKPPVPGPRRVIGYMGTDHRHDLAPVVPAIVRLLDAKPETSFEIFGSTPIPEELRRFGDRVRTIKAVADYHQFVETLASLQWAIGICALARTPFNAVKADTKWVEYTASGFAVVASRGTVYDHCCSNGCGILVESEEEWLAALESLLDDTVRTTQVTIAQNRLRKDYNPERLIQQISEVFEKAHLLASGKLTMTSGGRSSRPSLSVSKRIQRYWEIFRRPHPTNEGILEETSSSFTEGRTPAFDATIIPNPTDGVIESPPDDLIPEPQLTPPSSVCFFADEVHGDEMHGWAWSPAEAGKPETERQALELWCGRTKVGTLPRKIIRLDADQHVGDPIGPKGFVAPIGGLVALWHMLGRTSEVELKLCFAGETMSLAGSDGAIRELAFFRTLRHATDPVVWNVIDLWWANSHLLKIRSDSLSSAGTKGSLAVLRILQPIPEPDGHVRLTLVDEQPLKVGKAGRITNVGVRNPLVPIVLVGCDSTGHIVFIDVIPFPSLLRGGAHESELAATGQNGGTLKDFQDLNDSYLAEQTGWSSEGPPHIVHEIAFNLWRATGAELIFDPDIRQWLGATLGISILAVGVDERRTDDLGDETFVTFACSQLADVCVINPRKGRARLNLAENAIPTIASAVSRRWPVPTTTRPGQILVVDESLPNRRWLVRFPGMMSFSEDDGLRAMPYLQAIEGHADPKEVRGDDPLPLAIVFRNLSPQTDLRLVFPIPKDVAEISIPSTREDATNLVSVLVVVARPSADLRVFLSSVAAQRIAGNFELLVGAVNPTPAQYAILIEQLERLLPGRARVLIAGTALRQSEILNVLAAEAKGDTFVIVETSVMMYDERTLQTLAGIASSPNAGTVGCMLLKPDSKATAGANFLSAGFFPAKIDFAIAPHIALAQPDVSTILPAAIYPVAANSGACWAVSATSWREAGGLAIEHFPNTAAEIDLAWRLTTTGRINCCTTKVAALLEEPAMLKPVSDVGAITHLDLKRFISALQTSTILRSF